MLRKVEKMRTTLISDANVEGGFRHTRNRQEKYENKAECVNLLTVHTRHKEANGTRYTIEQTATASRADTLAKWVERFPLPGTLSADGLTFTVKTEI
jgi:hypothetical protein